MGIGGTRPLYLDYAATWPMRSEVWEAMSEELANAYNPASSHLAGRRAHRTLEVARGQIADLLQCSRAGVYFTGGGTQSDNLAILGFCRAHSGQSPALFVSEIEHKACLEAAERAAAEGASLHMIPVDIGGTVDIGWLDRELSRWDGVPKLVSVMWANNEIGTVQPMDDVVEVAHRHGALVHTDAVQALGKVEVQLKRTPVDLLSATAHKLGGPVGIGILYARPGVSLEPLSYGGGQERSMWPGTQNPIGAVGFAKALELATAERSEHVVTWLRLRDHLEQRVLNEIPGAVIHAREARHRLPHLVNLGIPECDGGAVLVSLDFEGISVSGGSACGSDSGMGSDVLKALDLGIAGSYATVRFSFGPETTMEDVDRSVDALVQVVRRVSQLTTA